MEAKDVAWEQEERKDHVIFKRANEDGTPQEIINPEAFYNDTITYLQHKELLLWGVVAFSSAFFLWVLL